MPGLRQALPVSKTIDREGNPPVPIDGDRTKHNATGAGSKPNQKAGRKMPTHLKNTKRPLDIHIAARRCPACAGLRLAIFVVNGWTVPANAELGDPAERAEKILPKIGKKIGSN